jgi:hypothetical protein
MENETVSDNTSVEVSSVEESSVEYSPELLSENLSVDDLLGLNSDVAPEFEEDVNHTGLKPLHEWMKHLPEDVRKHLANIRSDYTKKSQQIASMKKQLEDERRSLSNQKEATLNNPLARRAAQIAANEEEYDLYDPEGMKKEIERQSAKMLSEMLKPAREEIMLQQRKIALNDFKRENPELTNPEYRLEIAKMLQDRPELKLEDAFYIVKSKMDSAKSREAAKVVAAQTQGRREALQKTSNGSATVPKGSPKFRDAWEAFQYHKAQGTK